MGCASRAVSCLCCPCKCLVCGLFSCLCSILISLVVTAGLLAVILYLIFRPRMIAATADSASLATFTLSPTITSGGSSLAYNLTVGVTVRNPNKRVGLYYDDVEALALYKDQRFGYADPGLGSFYQGAEAATKLTPGFYGQHYLLRGDIAAAEFRKERADGNFAIDVGINAKIRIKVWAFIRVPGPKAKIICKLSVPAPGAANGSPFQPTKCKVGF